METITIQGHRGLRTVEVRRKRNFLTSANASVVTPVAGSVETVKKESPEPYYPNHEKEMVDFETGLMSMINQFNEENPRRQPRRGKNNGSDDYSNKQAYRRDKSWRN